MIIEKEVREGMGSGMRFAIWATYILQLYFCPNYKSQARPIPFRALPFQLSGHPFLNSFGSPEKRRAKSQKESKGHRPLLSF